ncbi:uncharacterized protein LOC123715629 [Pieris brassicae]|uniref:Uncharacterized protein n=1 Tax=Pieris brassicae TaxID=7116 RepID=A0A9P0XC20_PIEBR|nr:uncharacterized protein LOC123715629 [Pieris brassicae]XP_045526771.1 uncharacterized protein LOC123715629 [Pieris brassicae]XP_045526772.1 uncharacterized protein LOC123715629 [Pieris brassicae]CAH4032589.1 unnamed protein product [Pieris brassicae]
MSHLLVALALLTAEAAHAQLRPADAPPPLNDTRCGSECVRCSADGCIKCARLLIWPGGSCSHECPSGTRESWAHDDQLMGRVCYPGHVYHEILIGGACGVAACIILVAVGAAYARCKKRPHAHPLPQPNHDDDAQLREFHKQLDCLRPHAYTLLAILNHTRHQVRELYQLGNNDAAMAYSCVLSDLAKLLILLNKQQIPVVPEEWSRLASWADRILKRYSRLGINQSCQQTELVNLSSPPSQRSDDTTQSFSTFKPPSYSPTSYDSHILDKENPWSGRPPSYSQIESESIVLTDPWERRPIVRRESVWLEDELFEMTRRPQDELTTEL